MIKKSKYLSYILRHDPSSINLIIDDEGWAIIDELIEKSNNRLNKDILFFIVNNCDKKRFSISSDGTKIRANQGHSINVNLNLVAVKPPTELYHGTATRFLESILSEGIKPKTRQYVQLTEDYNTAVSVGARHGKPIVLSIDTASMYNDEFEFFLSENNVWLIKYIPSKYIKQ